MMRGLLEKELRQHGFTLAFLGLILLGGLAVIGGHDLLSRAKGGGFAAVQLLLIFFVPLAGIVLGQILIASEFRQKTQLFLEGLPLPRWRMLAVKFGLGLGALAGAIAIALVFAWWSARHAEAMTPRFVLILGLKSLGWIWFFYSLCFVHAFLGRYRVVVGVTLFFSLIWAGNAGVALSTLPPFSLVDERFAFERMIIPARDLVVTGLLGTALATLGFALGLVRDATVAALLAEKMTFREKIVMAMLSLGILLGAAAVHERRQAVAAVRIPGSIEVQKDVARVSASAAVDSPTRVEIKAIESTARHCAEELSALAAYLRCSALPAVYIVHRRDLDAGEFIKGDLKPPQGLLVRANLTAEGFKAEALDAWLCREILLLHSGTLAERERNAWVFDGFLAWWPRSQHGQSHELDAATRATARAVMPADFAPHHLHAWYSVRKAVSADKAKELAASGLAVLASVRGPESQRAFLSAMLSPHKPVDVRGWLIDVRHTAPASLRAATDWSEDDLVRAWRAALAAEATATP